MSSRKALAIIVINIVPFVGTIYYFIPGFTHIFASDDVRINYAFLCLIIFLIAFISTLHDIGSRA